MDERYRADIYYNKKNQNILLNWKFNGWAKYKNYRADNKVNLRIKSHYKGNSSPQNLIKNQ